MQENHHEKKENAPREQEIISLLDSTDDSSDESSPEGDSVEYVDIYIPAEDLSDDEREVRIQRLSDLLEKMKSEGMTEYVESMENFCKGLVETMNVANFDRLERTCKRELKKFRKTKCPLQNAGDSSYPSPKIKATDEKNTPPSERNLDHQNVSSSDSSSEVSAPPELPGTSESRKRRGSIGSALDAPLLKQLKTSHEIESSTVQESQENEKLSNSQSVQSQVGILEKLRRFFSGHIYD
ncbi:unnamed protein product [Oikopleura dioica]|uniref:Uncharacterized protein n=1 Tax=Oikopleura dioica TaxID=34765 RepID=E4XTB0_OIKDI|nr:unnamed protein product [Oikopleura dioica]